MIYRTADERVDTRWALLDGGRGRWFSRGLRSSIALSLVGPLSLGASLAQAAPPPAETASAPAGQVEQPVEQPGTTKATPAEASGPTPEATASPSTETPSPSDPAAAPTQPASDVAPAAEPPPTAQADEDQTLEKAAELFRRGTRKYEAGEYAAAVVYFEKAWELSEEPSMLYNIGQAYWKRYSVEPNIDFLRRAKALFINFDKLMVAMPEYDPDYKSSEIIGYIQQIDQQIAAADAQEERKRRETAAAEAAASAAAIERVRRSGPNEQERRMMRLRTTKGIGVGFIVLGSLSALGIGVGIILRTNAKLLLDTAQDDRARGINFISHENDRRFRNIYKRGGELTFVSILATSIMLPVGIGMTILGGRLIKNENRKNAASRTTSWRRGRKIRLRPAGRLLDLRF